jgi:hypothetical protein
MSGKSRGAGLALAGALLALGAYGLGRHQGAAGVGGDLRPPAPRSARPAPDEIRQQALLSVDVRSADEAAVRRLAGFLADASPEVRRSAAEKLGEAPPERRATALSALVAALDRETEPTLRRALLDNLVRCGRGEAADVLERLAARSPDLRTDAEEYLALVRAGYADWDEILDRKERLEAGRTAR